MEILFLEIAEADLEEIITFILQENQVAAGLLLSKIEHEIESLKQHPYRGALPKDEIIRLTGVRFLVVEDYLVFYFVTNDRIEIRRILHAKRDYTALMK